MTTVNDIKDDIERPDQRKEDSSMHSDEAAFKAPRVDHTQEELEEGKGTTILSMNNADSHIHEEKENREDIVQLELSNSKLDH